MDNIKPRLFFKDAQDVSKPKSTFTIEALIILACLLLLFAIVFMAFAKSYVTSVKTAQLEHAMLMAENTAEQFAANPSSVEGYTDGNYVLTVDVRDDKTTAGAMRYATIKVDYAGAEIYSLMTAKYIPDSANGDGFSASADGSSSENATSSASASTSVVATIIKRDKGGEDAK